MQRFMSFVAGSMCGLAFGAVAALLLTPISGRDLKATGRARVEKLASEVRRAYDDKQTELKIQLEMLKVPKPVE
jgi:gas vesicle protein